MNHPSDALDAVIRSSEDVERHHLLMCERDQVFPFTDRRAVLLFPNCELASGKDPVWKGLIEEWSGRFQEWQLLLATAQRLVAGPEVTAAFGDGDASPTDRWGTSTGVTLRLLAASLDSAMFGLDGIEFVRKRESLPVLPESFCACVCELRVAAAQARSVEAQSGHQTPKLPELGPHDRQAWQLSLLRGMTQAKVADQLNEEHGECYSQGQVSKMIGRAKRHAEASGLADLVEGGDGPRARTRVVHPSRLELGRRADGRTPRPSEVDGANGEED